MGEGLRESLSLLIINLRLLSYTRAQSVAIPRAAGWNNLLHQHRCLRRPHIPHGRRFSEVHKQRRLMLGGKYRCIVWDRILAIARRQEAEWGIQVRVIVVKEQVLLEKKIGWLTCRNLTMQDRPRCSGRNHEFLHA